MSAAQLQSAPVQDQPAPGAEVEPETFGARLRRLRKERGMTLLGLARTVGVSKPTMWKWETDEVRPRPKSLAALGVALGVSERELLSGDVAPGARSAPAREERPASSGPASASALHRVIDECKQRIAGTAGTPAENVTVTIRF